VAKAGGSVRNWRGPGGDRPQKLSQQPLQTPSQPIPGGGSRVQYRRDARKGFLEPTPQRPADMASQQPAKGGGDGQQG
jgi:hypothetical protein